MAWCIRELCPDVVRASTIEKFWETGITGDVDVVPEWSFGEVLANVTERPTEVARWRDTEIVLNKTMLMSHEDWENMVTLYYFFHEVALESYFGYLLFLIRTYSSGVWCGSLSRTGCPSA